MKYLFILLLFSVSLMGQDFNMMKKHLNKMEDKVYAPKEWVNSDGDSVITYYVRASDDIDSNYSDEYRLDLRNQFWKIYKEEYLRYVAREMLKVQFERKWTTVKYDTVWDYWSIMYEDSLLEQDSIMYVYPREEE